MMYRISGALAALIVATPAFAADPIFQEPAGIAVYDWSGFHIGVGGGRGAIVHDVTTPFIPGLGFDGIGGEGIFGQVTVGYDHVFNNGIVLGAMLSGRYGNIETTFDTPPFIIIPGSDLSVEADYGFDVIARLGYSIAPNTLAYVLGGYSWQHFETNLSFGGLNATYDFDEGGYVLGIGMETVVRNNWTLRSEYRYSDYSTHNGGILGLGFLNIDPSIHTFHTTLNYRLNGGPHQRGRLLPWITTGAA